MLERHRIAREGLVAGVIGATSVALWFFAVDLASGNPLRTPALLGGALLSILGPGTDQLLARVFAYTVFHYAAFIVAGLILAAAIHSAADDPELLAGSLMLFIIFELGFYGLVALLSEPQILGTLAWYQIAAGNLIAALAMGAYIWKAHPSLVKELEHALSGTK